MGAPLICVIEDEDVIARAVAARLRAEGFAVEVAQDGPEGVALCDRTRPDLVVLDLMLPGLDGLEVCRRIQRDRPVPVLMLTARDDEADVLVGLGVGADDYMTKPFSPRELVARVRALLRRVERRPAPAGDAVRVGGLEPREGERGDVVAVGAQGRGDLVPRPCAQPEARNQDDRCTLHGRILWRWLRQQPVTGCG